VMSLQPSTALAWSRCRYFWQIIPSVEHKVFPRPFTNILHCLAIHYPMYIVAYESESPSFCRRRMKGTSPPKKIQTMSPIRVTVDPRPMYPFSVMKRSLLVVVSLMRSATSSQTSVGTCWLEWHELSSAREPGKPSL
jgi:hypothetical protein